MQQSFIAQVADTISQRSSSYGSPSENHELTAQLFSKWLSTRLGVPVLLTAEDVCILNTVQKISRLANGTKDDTHLDICGYTENVAMLKPEQRNTPEILSISRKAATHGHLR